MRLRLNRYIETVRSSLFLVPMVAVALAVLLGQLGLALDARLDSATISFAGIAFSVSLLIIQLGSSQYSPRVVHTLFRDPFNKRVMGLVVGTFTFSLIVLRSVRSPFEDGNDPVIPNLSVAASVVFGVGSILAIVAFINHSAHSMDTRRRPPTRAATAAGDSCSNSTSPTSNSLRSPTTKSAGRPGASSLSVCTSSNRSHSCTSH